MRETNGTPWTTSELPFSVSIREARLVALSTPIELGARFPGLAEAPIWGDGAWLAMPVHDDGVVVGAVGAIFDQSRSFDQDYLMAAQRAGDRLGALLGEEQVRRVVCVASTGSHDPCCAGPAAGGDCCACWCGDGSRGQ